MIIKWSSDDHHKTIDWAWADCPCILLSEIIQCFSSSVYLHLLSNTTQCLKFEILWWSSTDHWMIIGSSSNSSWMIIGCSLDDHLMVIARLSNDHWIIIHAFYYRQSSNVALQAFAFIDWLIEMFINLSNHDINEKTGPYYCHIIIPQIINFVYLVQRCITIFKLKNSKNFGKIS